MTIDRTAQMIDRLPEQFKGLPGWEGLLTDIGAEIQEFEDASQILLALSISNATGQSLIDFGTFVGEPPSGLSDDLYRRRVIARIATNRSHGRVEDLIRIIRAFLYDDSPAIEIQRSTIANVIVRVFEPAMDEDTAHTLIEFLRAATKGAASAGVRVVLEATASPLADTFTFDIGPGFDIGHLATSYE